jgi:hypothetical protein
MIKHIVCFKLKETAEGASKTDNALKIKSLLEALPKTIPQIKLMEVGINVVPSDAAYDVALYSAFSSIDDLNIYLKHPDHIKAADFVGKVRESRVVVDYKI